MKNDMTVRDLFAAAALAEHGYTHKFADCYVDDFDAWLDGDAWPGIPKVEAT